MSMDGLQPLARGRSAYEGFPDHILDSLLEGCQVIGRDWRYLYVNDAVARQGRRPKEELLGRTMMEVYPGIEETPMFAALRQCMEDRISRHLENEFTFPDGSRGWFELRIAPVPEGVFILSLETTDRKRAEVAQRLEAIGQLAGGVAHDFNNLLMVQMGYCSLLESQLGPGDPLAEAVAAINGAAQRAAALTHQLLALGRRQVLQPEVLDLNAVVAELEKMLVRVIGEDIELVTALADGLGRVQADRGQLEQVILNLAVNARDAMHDGGELALVMGNVVFDDEPARRHVGAAVGPHVMLEVSDTGCGMDETTRSRLFEPFFTTKPPGKGTGLGLATAYGIVKQSGGSIWVDSEPGGGSTFTIYLPRVEAEPTPRTAADGEVRAGKGELVLLAEDDQPLRGLFAQMVEKLGYRVIVAAGGAEALTAVENGPLRVDLLITDVVMPGMRGPVLVERLRESQPGLKVLYISGYAGDGEAPDVVLSPRTRFLKKPFTMAELAAKMRDALDSG
jgi:two-component system cell cycle sensor histidine kinase/response regulator CckA